MSPTVFKPRGFTGAYDQRFVKPFQPQTGAPPVDPLAGVTTLYFSDTSVKQHGFTASGTIKQHASTDSGWVVQHAYGYDLTINQGG